MFVIRSLETGLYVAALIGSIHWTPDKEKAHKYYMIATADFAIDFNNIPNSEAVFYGES